MKFEYLFLFLMIGLSSGAPNTSLGKSDVNLIDYDENSLRQKLTDKQHDNDFIGEVKDSWKKLEHYIKAVLREITKRWQVKDLLEQALKALDSLHEEAKNVANADLSPMPSPDFDAPSPISDDDTDDFKLPDDGGDTTPTYTGPGSQDTPPLPSTPNKTGERKPNTAEFQREQMTISEHLTKLAAQDQPNPASVTEDSGPYKAWSISISPVAAAGFSATVEVGLAVDTSGQVLLFFSHCSGLKMDVSIEADVAVGHWFRLDDVIGPSFTLGVGNDLLEVPASTRERGANIELVFNSAGNLVGTTISVGVGKGPILPIDFEGNFDICETSELYRFNLI